MGKRKFVSNILKYHQKKKRDDNPKKTTQEKGTQTEDAEETQEEEAEEDNNETQDEETQEEEAEAEEDNNETQDEETGEEEAAAEEDNNEAQAEETEEEEIEIGANAGKNTHATFSLDIIREFLKMLRCPDCNKLGGITLEIISQDFVRLHLYSGCNFCDDYKYEFWSTNESYNNGITFARIFNGMKETHFRRFLALGSFSGVNKKGKEIFASSYDSKDSKAWKCKKAVNDAILEGCKSSIAAKIADFIEFHQKNPEEQITVGIDGNYQDRGVLRNQAQACLVSIIGTMKNKPSVLGYVVAKRAQEAKEETIKKHSKGRIVPKGIQANSLETFGVNIIFEEVLLKIHEALPGKKIFICADKDAKVRSNATNQFKTGPNAGKDILPKNSYQWTYDAAHLFKNIHATVGNGLPVGSSKDKFTKKQLTELGTRVQKTSVYIHSNKLSYEEAELQMKKTRCHSYGVHDFCDENCKKLSPILQPHGNLSKEKIMELVDNLFEKKFGKEFIESLLNTGSTSYNEYLHSLIYNRGLYTKGTAAGLCSQNFEVACCLGIQIYNDSQDTTLRKIGQSIGFTPAEVGLKRLEYYEKKRKKHNETHVIPNKSAVKEKRRMSQKQNNNMGTYANRAQREIDSKRAEERAKLQKQKSIGSEEI